MMELTEAIPEALAQPAAYVVGPADRSYLYKGSARNLRERLLDHRAGRVSRTKNRRPLHLFFVRYFSSYAEARVFEQELKSGAGRRWLKEELASAK